MNRSLVFQVDPNYPLGALAACSQNLDLISDLLTGRSEAVELGDAATCALIDQLRGMSIALAEVESLVSPRLLPAEETRAPMPRFTEPRQPRSRPARTAA